MLYAWDAAGGMANSSCLPVTISTTDPPDRDKPAILLD